MEFLEIMSAISSAEETKWAMRLIRRRLAGGYRSSGPISYYTSLIVLQLGSSRLGRQYKNPLAGEGRRSRSVDQ